LFNDAVSSSEYIALNDRTIHKLERISKAVVLAASIIRAIRSSELSVNFYHTTRRNNIEDRHFHTLRTENLESHYEGQFSVRYEGTF
jgi:hypothetical protein